MVEEVHFINSATDRNSFVRIKIKNKDVMALALIDSGNLSKNLVSYDLAKTLGLAIKPSHVLLRAPNQSNIDVVGFVENINIFIEDIPSAIPIQKMLVIKNLSYPINLGRTFLSENKALLDFSASPGYLKIQHKKIPLITGHSNLLTPSLDFRFRNLQEKLRKLDINGDTPLAHTRQQWVNQVEVVENVQVDKLVQDIDAKTPSNKTKDNNPTSRCASNLIRPPRTDSNGMSATVQKISDIRYPEHINSIQNSNSAKIPDNQPTLKPKTKMIKLNNRGIPHKVELIEEQPEVQHVQMPQQYRCEDQVQFLLSKYNTYNKADTTLPPKAAKLIEVSTVHLGKRNNQVLFIPDISRKYFVENNILPCEGIYKTQDQKLSVLLVNLNDKDMHVPAGMKLGSIRIKDDGSIQSVNQIITHGHKNKLTPQQWRERRKYIFDELQLKNNTTLTEKQKETIVDMFADRFDAVSIGEDDLGKTELIKCNITLEPGTVPTAAKVRPLNPFQEKDLERQIKDWQTAGIIEPSVSPWAAAMVPVRKKDSDKLRWTMDYRSLNQVTVPDRYPLPNIEANLQNMAGSKYFSALDISQAYHCIEMDDASKPLTAFISPLGTFQFTRLPFGLRNAPSLFSRFIKLALQSLPSRFLSAYMDDVIIYSQTIEEHIEHLRRVLDVLLQHGLKLRLKKCKIAQTSVDYLGHHVSEAGIHMKQDYIERLLDWPRPQTNAQLRSFLGAVNYYRRFIKDLPELTAEMNSQKNKHTLDWTSSMEANFEALKKKFVEYPIRTFPDFSKDALPFILESDWSKQGKGVVLKQQNKDGCDRFIACDAVKNNTAESNYSANKGELAAIVHGLKKFDHILSYKPFILRTDAMALTHLHNLKEQRGIYSRWRDWISAFNFTVEHKKGTENYIADSLSRRTDLQPQIEEDDKEKDILDVYQLDDSIDDEIEQNHRTIRSTVSLTNLTQLTHTDPDLQHVIQWINRGTPPSHEERKGLSYNLRMYADLYDRLKVQNGCVLLKDKDSNRWKYCIPRQLTQQLIKTVHDAVHLGIGNTVEQIRRSAHWPGLVKEVEIYVSNCVHCLQKKNSPYKKQYEQYRPMYGRFNQRLFIDTVGPLTPAKYRGEIVQHILTIQDAFTRYLVAVPIKNLEARTVAKALIEGWFDVHSTPEEVYSDNGRSFTSTLLKEVHTMYGIKQIFSLPYTPEANRVERAHRTLGNLMRANNSVDETQWPQKLSSIVLAYNTMKNRMTGHSPFYAVFGRTPRLPSNLFLPEINQPEIQSMSDFVQKLQDNYHKIYNSMIQLQQTAVERERERDNQKQGQPSFEVGDTVYVFSHKPRPGVSLKLQRKWVGPFLIQEVISPSLIRITKIGEESSGIVITTNKAKKVILSSLPNEGPNLPEQQDLQDALEDEIDAEHQVPQYTENLIPQHPTENHFNTGGSNLQPYSNTQFIQQNPSFNATPVLNEKTRMERERQMPPRQEVVYIHKVADKICHEQGVDTTDLPKEPITEQIFPLEVRQSSNVTPEDAILQEFEYDRQESLAPLVAPPKLIMTTSIEPYKKHLTQNYFAKNVPDSQIISPPTRNHGDILEVEQEDVRMASPPINTLEATKNALKHDPQGETGGTYTILPLPPREIIEAEPEKRMVPMEYEDSGTPYTLNMPNQMLHPLPSPPGTEHSYRLHLPREIVRGITNVGNNDIIRRRNLSDRSNYYLRQSLNRRRALPTTVKKALEQRMGSELVRAGLAANNQITPVPSTNVTPTTRRQIDVEMTEAGPSSSIAVIPPGSRNLDRRDGLQRTQSLDELSSPDKEINLDHKDTIEYQYAKTVSTRGNRDIDKITSLANIEPDKDQPVSEGPSQRAQLEAQEALRNPGIPRRTRGASKALSKSHRRARSAERTNPDRETKERHKRAAATKVAASLFPPITRRLKDK